MKKLFSAFLAVVMLCCIFAISANMTSEAKPAAEDGVVFKDIQFMYAVDKPLESEPLTVEVRLFFDKRKDGASVDAGTFFGNYHWDTTSNTIDFGIDASAPVFRIRDDDVVKEYKFDKVKVHKSEWVHVAIVIDNAKKEARCYFEGELAQTLPLLEYKPLSLLDYKIGSNNAYMNPDYFRGAIKSLAVYSDVRTDAEIKKDVETLDKSGLMIAYDFTGANDRPAVVKDISGNGNDALRNRMFFDEEPTPASEYAYTFAVLGDTQSMAINFPDHFSDMYNFIYDNINSMNIEAVLGLGDITDTKDGAFEEWETAFEGLRIVDDYTLNIPITGDHDNVWWFNKYMSQIKYAKIAKLYQSGDYRNGYIATEIGGIPFLFIQLQKGPGDEILNWANKVVESHPNHRVIIATHAYLHHDGTFLNLGDPHLKFMDNYADAMWDKFIAKHKNIVMVLSGHIGHDYVVVNQRKGNNGNIVTEMLIDFQSVDNAAKNNKISDNGVGVVNMFHVSADGKKLTIETYSTVLGKKFMDLNQITLDVDLHGGKTYVKPEKTPVPERVTAVQKTEIQMTIGSVFAKVNGETKVLDAAPINRNSRTMLPVRFLAENLGATVEWNDATKTATLKDATTTIAITIGASSMTVNGESVALDSPAIIDNSRTYLPLRAIANALGVTNENITWDDATKTATLVK